MCFQPLIADFHGTARRLFHGLAAAVLLALLVGQAALANDPAWAPQGSF